MVGTTVATLGACLMLATGFPFGITASEAARASTTLAELVARSPGSRIGGIALKAKRQRVARVASVGKDAPRRVAATPAIAGAPAAGPGAGAPLTAPPPGTAFPAGTAVAPAAAGIAPAPGPFGGFAGSPGGSGGAFIVGPGAGGGAPGAGGGAPGADTGPGVSVTPTPTPPAVLPTPTPTATVPAISAVPEPATWLTMILGFGAVGASLRTRRRAVRVV